MVGTITWFSQRKRSKSNTEHASNNSRWITQHEKQETLGILAFDTAKTISWLISLYKSLSNDEIIYLNEQVIRGRGVAHLTSEDEGFLLTLACAERLEVLDQAANGVSMLSRKCLENSLVNFEQMYKDLKNGYVDMDKFMYGSKEVEKSLNKMEKRTLSTMELYEEIESLSELEASERKLSKWRKSGNQNKNASYELFDQKIAGQRKLVRHLKEVSLWNQSHDKIVGFMAKIVCILFARICTIFGPYVSVLPHKNNDEYHQTHGRNLCQHQGITRTLFDFPSPQTSMSGPIQGEQRKATLVRFLSRKDFSMEEMDFGLGLGLRHPYATPKNNKVFQAAPPSTVGGAGLATRYANVILLVKRYLNSNSGIGEEARHNLYSMLPVRVKSHIRSKLRVPWRETGNGVGVHAFTEGWRDALHGILEWLVPMAQDTLTWQAQRCSERLRLDTTPTVLLLQTLHYADLEKTEFAIAEVLSGLSCIYWYGSHKIA